MATIMIVDDDVEIRKILVAVLERCGHVILEAADGRIALELYRCHDIDIVITDLIMPEYDGIEMIIALQQLTPDVKIIAMSGGGFNETDEYLKSANALGALQTFSKPFNIDDIVDAVAQFC